MQRCKVLQLSAEGVFPLAGNPVHQAAADLEVVGELQRPGWTYTFPPGSCPRASHHPTGTPTLHPAQLVANVRLPSICQLRDWVPQDGDGAIGGASWLDFLHGTNDVIDDADILVIGETEVGEGVVEAVEARGRVRHLHLVDPPVELRDEKTHTNTEDS